MTHTPTAPRVTRTPRAGIFLPAQAGPSPADGGAVGTQGELT